MSLKSNQLDVMCASANLGEIVAAIDPSYATVNRLRDFGQIAGYGVGIELSPGDDVLAIDMGRQAPNGPTRIAIGEMESESGPSGVIRLIGEDGRNYPDSPSSPSPKDEPADPFDDAKPLSVVTVIDSPSKLERRSRTAYDRLLGAWPVSVVINPNDPEDVKAGALAVSTYGARVLSRPVFGDKREDGSSHLLNVRALRDAMGSRGINGLVLDTVFDGNAGLREQNKPNWRDWWPQVLRAGMVDLVRVHLPEAGNTLEERLDTLTDPKSSPDRELADMLRVVARNWGVPDGLRRVGVVSYMKGSGLFGRLVFPRQARAENLAMNHRHATRLLRSSLTTDIAA